MSASLFPLHLCLPFPLTLLIMRVRLSIYSPSATVSAQSQGPPISPARCHNRTSVVVPGRLPKGNMVLADGFSDRCILPCFARQCCLLTPPSPTAKKTREQKQRIQARHIPGSREHREDSFLFGWALVSKWLQILLVLLPFLVLPPSAARQLGAAMLQEGKALVGGSFLGRSGDKGGTVLS